MGTTVKGYARARAQRGVSRGLLSTVPSPPPAPSWPVTSEDVVHSKHPATDTDSAHFPGNPGRDTQLPPLPTMRVCFSHVLAPEMKLGGMEIKSRPLNHMVRERRVAAPSSSWWAEGDAPSRWDVYLERCLDSGPLEPTVGCLDCSKTISDSHQGLRI